MDWGEKNSPTMDDPSRVSIKKKSSSSSPSPSNICYLSSVPFYRSLNMTRTNNKESSLIIVETVFSSDNDSDDNDDSSNNNNTNKKYTKRKYTPNDDDVVHMFPQAWNERTGKGGITEAEVAAAEVAAAEVSASYASRHSEVAEKEENEARWEESYGFLHRQYTDARWKLQNQQRLNPTLTQTGGKEEDSSSAAELTSWKDRYLLLQEKIGKIRRQLSRYTAATTTTIETGANTASRTRSTDNAATEDNKERGDGGNSDASRRSEEDEFDTPSLNGGGDDKTETEEENSSSKDDTDDDDHSSMDSEERGRRESIPHWTGKVCSLVIV